MTMHQKKIEYKTRANLEMLNKIQNKKLIRKSNQR